MTTMVDGSSESLAQRADKLRVVLDNLPTGIVAADSEGRLLFSNLAAEKLLCGDVVSVGLECISSVNGWYHPDQDTVLTPQQLPLSRAIRGEKVINELFLVRTSHRSSGMWLRVNGLPLKDSKGVVFGGIVMFDDFTQGRKAMQLLVLLSRVVEQTADNVVVTDTHGLIQYVNPAFEVTSGFAREEAVGRTPRILKSGLHDAEFYRQLWGRLLQGQARKGMIINRKKTGELYWSQQTITPIRDESGRLTHFVSVSQDITDARKRQEQEFQLQLARDVQRRLYGSPPALEGFDLGASAHPAYETGGDYFDFVAIKGGSLIVAVGDVVGHGLGSALIMALTRAYVRSFASMTLSLDEILTRVNSMLLGDLQPGQYVTLFLAHLNPQQRTLSYASAGHVPGLIFPGTGEVKFSLESTGPPLGIFPDSSFSLSQSIQLISDQILVLHTDGILESAAPNGLEFGADRISEYVRTHRHETAQEIANGFYQAVRAYMKDELQADDITSVVIKVV